MKKNWTIILIVLILIVTTGCNGKLTEKIPPEPKLVETSTDPTFLTEIWDGYLTDLSFTINNGYVNWTSFEEIPKNDLLPYLFLQMQRAGDLEGTVPQEHHQRNSPFWVKREKLELYCQKFFNQTPDFKTIDMPSRNVYYDTVNDAVVFYPYWMNSLPVVTYNQPDLFPNNALESIDIYDDGSIIATLSQVHVTAINEETDIVYSKIKLNKREDGSYYFVENLLEYAKTDYIKIEGTFKELTPPNNLYDYSYLGFKNDEVMVLSLMTDTQVSLLTFNINTGEYSTPIVQPLDNAQYQYYPLVKNNVIYLISKTQIDYINLDLTGGFKTTIIPGNISPVLDISIDAGMLLYFDEESNSIGIHNVAEKTNSIIPNTQSYTPTNDDDIMRGTRFGSAKFVDGDSKVFLEEYGYESTNGYLLHEMETNKQQYYEYSAGYGGGKYISDTGAYLTSHNQKIGNERTATIINFKTWEADDTVAFASIEGWVAFTGEYIAYLPYDYVNHQPISTLPVSIINTKDFTIKELDCRITFPTSGAATHFFTTSMGDVYATISYLGENRAILIENK